MGIENLTNYKKLLDHIFLMENPISSMERGISSMEDMGFSVLSLDARVTIHLTVRLYVFR